MKNISSKKWLKWASFLSVLTLILAFSVFSFQKSPAKENIEANFQGCTSIMAGRLATTDGSVITAHSCDGNYRTWVEIESGQSYSEGATTKVYHGLLHTETSWDQRGVMEQGEIPQAKKTYAFLNTAYPCMNEKQLAIGETTIGGRRELRNSEGMFYIEELQRIALQRCTKAKEAIKLIGKLVKEYGYCDRGECLTFADPKEVWHFEIFGAGPLEIGAVWAAVRIPDDHVGVSANIPRIGELDLNDPDHYMASDNVYSLAQEMGWWDPEGGKPFKFWEAYSGRKPFSTREYFVLSAVAPSLNLSMDSEELPFSVKPDKKISVRDVMALYRQTYQGTELDMTKNLMVKKRRSDELILSPIVNPWMNWDFIGLLNTIKPGIVEPARTIAISGCSYSEVLQCRDWLPDEVGGIAWLAFDNPGQSPRIPVFAGVTELPPSFEIGAQHRFRTDSACWAFRRANRLSQVRWGVAGKYIKEAISEFEEKAFTDLPMIEKKVKELHSTGNSEENMKKIKEYLTKYTNDFSRAAMHKYWELGDMFWGMFGRGF
ncbi:MAG TPA: C69 family dipeptidase [Acidobacteriota bacterium]|nr:C69 family dipeptidase [Acidobacteriota bacterium]